jgi:putative RNA 2'-phosphotransferase
MSYQSNFKQTNSVKRVNIRHSKRLSYILRHHPEEYNITLDDNGYALIDDIIANTDMTLDIIKEIVKTCDKQRFEMNDTHIRARQGHSVAVDLQLKKSIPPKYLFHGTPITALQDIKKTGLSKMKRHHVHLTSDVMTAFAAGLRRGKAVVLKINAKLMVQNGFDFFKTDNDVWLTDNVPATYIECVNESVLVRLRCCGVILFNSDLSMVVLVRANHWGFPKGKRNFEDSDVSCALRELYEETGIKDVTIHDPTDVLIEVSKKGKPSVKLLIGVTKQDVKKHVGPINGFEDELAEVKWMKLDAALASLTTKNRQSLLNDAIKIVKRY